MLYPGRAMRRLLVGFSCNNACVFCAQGELRASGPTFDVDSEIAAIERGDEVVVQGGEPTLSAALPGWIRAIVTRGAARVVVQTNGRRLAYAEYARELADAGAGKLELDVSLHGSDAAMHDWHTGVDGSFQQTARGLVNARASGLKCVVSVVVTRSNLRHLAEIVRVAHRVGARAVRFAPVERRGRAARSDVPLEAPAAMVGPRLRRALDEAAKLGLDASASRDADLPFAGLGAIERADGEGWATP